MKIIPTDFTKAMKALVTQEKYVNDYHRFDQVLYSEISTRKMNEDAQNRSLGIHAVGNSNTGCSARDNMYNMCPHVDQVTWSARRYKSGARNGSVTHVDWHFVSLTAVGQEAGR